MIYLEAVRFAHEANEAYYDRIPAIAQLKREGELRFSADVTFLCGENSSGKSTLIEAIAILCGFNPEGGSINYSFETNATHSTLSDCMTAVRGTKRNRDGYFLRAESLYNAATYLDELDRQPAASRQLRESYGGRSLHERSHGESFMSLLLNRFGGRGLYILDEPEAALSPNRQLVMLSRMSELVGKDSQFIISSHSPILLSYPGAQIYELSASGIEPVDYRQTSSFRITKSFLDCPERYLRTLTSEGNGYAPISKA